MIRFDDRGRQRALTAGIMALSLVVFDWPFLLRPMHCPYGFPTLDMAPCLWNFWWLKTALLAGQSPFLTDVLFSGETTSLFYHMLTIFYFLATLPVMLFTGNVHLAFSCSQLLSDGLGLFCFYRLARALGGSRALTALGAVCFVFCAFKFQHYNQLTMQSIWLLPATTWMALRLWRKARIRDGVMLGLCFIALILTSWHFLIFLGLASPMLISWFVTRDGLPWIDKARLRALAVSAAVVLPLLLLFVPMAVRHADMSDHQETSILIRTEWSASPLNYVTPGWMEWFWESRVKPVEFGQAENNPFKSDARVSDYVSHIFSYKTGSEHSIYIGTIPLLLLILYAGRRQMRRDLPLWVGVVVFVLISLGPHLIVLGPITKPDGSFVKLFTARLFDMPIFSSIKHISRFGLMAGFMLLTLAFSQKRIPFLSRGNITLAVCCITLALIAAHRLDVARFIVPVNFYAPPEEMIENLKNVPAEGTVMMYPSIAMPPESSGMYLQIFHERTQFYGYVSRRPKGVLERAKADPFKEALKTYISGDDPRPLLRALPAEKCPAMVIFPREYVGPQALRLLSAILHDTHGYNLIYSDEHVAFTIRPEQTDLISE